MKLPMSETEMELRNKFDFSKAERGRFSNRYKKGHTVTLLEGEPDEDDPLVVSKVDGQLTEIAGKHLLISRLVAAGFEVAEPLRDKGIDLVAYRDGEGGKDFAAYPIQLKASSQESFSLDKKYARFPRLLIAYVWNVQTPERSEVYALTFSDALQVMEKKGYAKNGLLDEEGILFRSIGRA